MMNDGGDESADRAALLTEVRALRESEERLRTENEHLLESQAELEASRDHYVRLYDCAPVAWLTLDSEGTIVDINLFAANLLGSHRRYLAGIPLKVLILPEDRRKFLDHLAARVDTGEAARCEVRLLARGADPIPVRLLTRRPSGPGGTYVTALLDLREYAQAKQEREELAAREQRALAANEAKDQFIAMLSHELRTPLTPVLAAVSALGERSNLSGELQRIFTMLQRNVTAEARLIDDLLDVTRISRGKMRIEKQPIDLHEVLREALDTLRTELESKRHSLVVALAASKPWVNGDPMRLRQVFWNILRNALKFTPEAGRIEVRSWNREDRIIVEINDNGRGIEPDSLGRVFTAFEQVSDDSSVPRGGLGLGLAICRGIVELHDGRVVASSRGLGHGARLQVELGVVDEPEHRSSAPPSSRSRAKSKARILLVEDHADTAEMLNELLSSVGYEVRIANSFQAALNLGVESGDVVVSDVGLGDGSGLDLVRLLRAKAPVKAIALSGFGTESDKRASIEAGFSAHLTKPVSFDALLAAIGGL